MNNWDGLYSNYFILTNKYFTGLFLVNTQTWAQHSKMGQDLPHRIGNILLQLLHPLLPQNFSHQGRNNLHITKSNGHFSVAILLDLSAPPDPADHSLLLETLFPTFCGNTLFWLISYQHIYSSFFFAGSFSLTCTQIFLLHFSSHSNFFPYTITSTPIHLITSYVSISQIFVSNLNLSSEL